jgi:Ca2+-transporting ATPase
MEVLQGLQYVMDHRIRGGHFVDLDESLMDRLCEGLLLLAGKTKGNLLRKRPTEEADIAFFLFGDFLTEGTVHLGFFVPSCMKHIH